MDETERRKALQKKEVNEAPRRSAGQVLTSFLSNAFSEQEQIRSVGKMPEMLKAQWRGMAGRTAVIGNTVFAFDSDGICEVPNWGNTLLDFELLLSRPDVFRVPPPETQVEIVPETVASAEEPVVEDEAVEPVADAEATEEDSKPRKRRR
jgi:hypothetical protein